MDLDSNESRKMNGNPFPQEVKQSIQMLQEFSGQIHEYELVTWWTKRSHLTHKAQSLGS